MWRLLLIAVLAPVLQAACGNGYPFCRQVTVAQRSGMAADLTSYTLTYNETDAWAKVTGSGGKVINTVTQSGGGAAITVPADLVFTSDSACTTLLPWEFKEYSSTTGALVVFLGGLTVSKTTTTSFYECYGKSSQTTFAGNVNGTWPSANKGRWHLGTVAGSVDAHDSTSGGNNGTVTGVTATTGSPVGTAGAFSGTTQYIALGTSSALDVYQDTTISAWINATDFSNYNALLTRTSGGSPSPFDMYMSVGSGYTSFFTGSQTTPLSANNPITTGTWVLVAVTVSGNAFTNYYNGVAAGTGTTNTTHTSGGTQTAYIGTRGDFVTMFKGKMSEVSIWNTASSVDKLLADYENQTGTTFYTVGSEQTGGSTSVPRRRVIN